MILAVVITYYPEKELLYKNIDAFIDRVNKVVIWENTPSDQRDNYRFIHNDKIEYHGDGINSISHALNYAWKYAKDNGYTHLLTMDQDSHFENFSFYLKQTIFNVEAPGGIYTPPLEEIRTTAYRDFEEINRPITSGMLIPVTLIDKIGGWNEDFKIDAVDDEFCLHAHSAGIKIYSVKGVVMQHCLGDLATREFLGRTIVLRNYSPHRLYSIYRNNIILMRKYPQFAYIKNDFKIWLYNIVWILLFESNKIKKFVSVVRGCYAGLITRL